MNVQRFYFKNREEFLTIRDTFHFKHRLGGSDIGSAAGQNKYCSKRRLYEILTGGIPKKDISSKQSIKDGILCEDIVAKKFEDRSGKKVHRENCVMVSDDAANLFASIDRKVENEESGLECKTANALNWDAFKDGKLPNSYIKQIKTYLKVTGLTRWYVYVWVMGCAEYCYLFTTDPNEAAVPKPEWVDAVYLVNEMELDECQQIAQEFFDKHVIPGIPPEIDGSEDETNLLKELYPEGVDLTPVNLDDQLPESELVALDLAKAKIKDQEAEVSRIENLIKDLMGSHAEASVRGRKITFKNNKASSKIDYQGIVSELQVDQAMIDKHTTVKPGARVLRIGKAK